MAGNSAPSRFNVEIDGGRENASRREQWLSRFDLYLEAIEAKTDRQQIALLLHIGGDKIEEIYEAKRDSSKARKDEKYADISKHLTDHFAHQKNTNVSILTFRQASQRQGECIDAFVVRLKILASTCGFGTYAET